MSNFQKIIKYFAIAFAALIIFNIVSGIIVGVDVLSSVFSNDKEINNNKLNEFKVNDDFSILDIELVSSQPIPTSTTTDLIFNIKHKAGSELTGIEDLTFTVTPTIQSTTPITSIPSLTKINNKL